jgi:hypothetical protein
MLRSTVVIFLLSQFAMAGREPGLGCSQWANFPITCENNYCIYNHRTHRCQEDHGDNPDCRIWNDRPKVCVDIYRCDYNAPLRRCEFVLEE